MDGVAIRKTKQKNGVIDNQMITKQK